MPVPRPWLVGSRHNVGTSHPLIGVRAAFGSYPGSPLRKLVSQVSSYYFVRSTSSFFYIVILLLLFWSGGYRALSGWACVWFLPDWNHHRAPMLSVGFLWSSFFLTPPTSHSSSSSSFSLPPPPSYILLYTPLLLVPSTAQNYDDHCVISLAAGPLLRPAAVFFCFARPPSRR